MTNDRRGRRHIPRTSPSVLPSRDPIRRSQGRTAKQNKTLEVNRLNPRDRVIWDIFRNRYAGERVDSFSWRSFSFGVRLQYPQL